MHTSTTLLTTLLSLLQLELVQANANIKAQTVDRTGKAIEVSRSATPLQWDKCTTWSSIWRFFPQRIDQMSLSTSTSEDYHIHIYEDSSCAIKRGTIENANHISQTIAITTYGKSTTPYLKDFDPNADNDQRTDIHYPNAANVPRVPGYDFSLMGAFKVEREKCADGRKWDANTGVCKQTCRNEEEEFRDGKCQRKVQYSGDITDLGSNKVRRDFKA